MHYLLTFSCYGTWLHGDARGSVHRNQNLPGSRFVEPSAAWEAYERSLMKESAYQLDDVARNIANQALQDACGYREWNLLAAHVRSTHIHIVLDLDSEPERAIAYLKARITHQIRVSGLDAGRNRFWSKFVSNVRLGDERAVEQAVCYVLEKQGSPMATYLNPNWNRTGG